MIYVRGEGEERRNGLNFYPRGGSHIGVVAKWNDRRCALRYSKWRRCLYWRWGGSSFRVYDPKRTPRLKLWFHASDA